MSGIVGRRVAAWADQDRTGGVVALPSGIVAGEKLVVIWCGRCFGSSPGSPVNSSGWTLLNSKTTSQMATRVLVKTATGGDTLTITATGTCYGFTSAFRVSTPGATAYSIGTAPSLDPPQVDFSKAEPGTWIVAVMGYAASGALWNATAPPPGFFNFASQSQTVLTGATADVGIATADTYINTSIQNPTPFTATVGSGGTYIPYTIAILNTLVAVGGRMKVKMGGTWAEKPVKVKIGGVWVEKPLKIRAGGTWKST